MRTFKFPATVFAALLASLMLTLVPESGRNTQDASKQDVSTQPIVKIRLPGIVVENENNPAKSPQPVDLIAAASLAVSPSAMAVEITSPTAADVFIPEEWPLTLYPELIRIAELENLPPEAALIELRPMLTNSDPVIRLAALESVADMSHLGVTSILTAALKDPLPQIRIAAIEALATSSDATAWVHLEPLSYDTDAELRSAAIEAFATLENPATITVLAGLLGDQDTFVRHQAVNALGEIGGDEAITYLLQARYDPDLVIRMNAIEILAEIYAGQ